ncbi:MAG: hypothetical protein KGL39_36265 [Patescibacteria group bacterium]|nr:hypothetical protein [Patescibacteria group bacterium]
MWALLWVGLFLFVNGTIQPKSDWRTWVLLVCLGGIWACGHASGEKSRD